MGKCSLTCGGGATKCMNADGGNICVDIQHDNTNCGMCGNACAGGFVCADGGCSLSCVAGQTPCDTDGGKLCVDLMRSDFNCGMCGQTCPMGFKCSMGMCAITCQNGLATCTDDAGDHCVDLNYDPNNCGKCGAQCMMGLFCSPINDAGATDAGACGLQCFGGSTKCGNKCVDTQNDRYNCNGCGNVCDGGGKCVMGACQ